ncbi:hypothetical protein ACV07N_16195, partial [Roseivirga echinicomitans]
MHLRHPLISTVCASTLFVSITDLMDLEIPRIWHQKSAFVACFHQQTIASAPSINPNRLSFYLFCITDLMDFWITLI